MVSLGSRIQPRTTKPPQHVLASISFQPSSVIDIWLAFYQPRVTAAVLRIERPSRKAPKSELALNCRYKYGSGRVALSLVLPSYCFLTFASICRLLFQLFSFFSRGLLPYETSSFHLSSQKQSFSQNYASADVPGAPSSYTRLLCLCFCKFTSYLSPYPTDNHKDPTNSSLALGQPCNPSSSQCAPGVSCYAVNSMEIPTCGSFQGTCLSTSQCATNECVNGFCAGPVLPFPGDNCTPFSGLPCAFGADCYAVNSMLIPVCGNIQSSCTWDGQCAFNDCMDGFCAGGLLSSSQSSDSSTSYSDPISSTPSASLPYYPANSTTSSTYTPSAVLTGSGTTGIAPTQIVVYVNGTATGGTKNVTSIVVVGPKTSTSSGGETTFRQGPTQTASVQSGGTVQAVGGISALAVIGMVMLML